MNYEVCRFQRIPRIDLDLCGVSCRLVTDEARVLVADGHVFRQVGRRIDDGRQTLAQLALMLQFVQNDETVEGDVQPLARLRPNEPRTGNGSAAGRRSDDAGQETLAGPSGRRLRRVTGRTRGLGTLEH